MTTDIERTRAEQVTGRTCNGLLEAMDLLTIYLGDRLGLYRSLAQKGPATPAQLAARTGVHERYVREWLEQQAVTGILAASEEVQGQDASRTYTLQAGHAAAIADPMSPYPVIAFAQTLVSAASVIPQLVEAFRTGGGIPWSDFGPDMIQGQGAFNRGWLLLELGARYLPGIQDIHSRLLSGPPAMVADLACGVGWASIAIARSYPGVQIVGYDLDAASIEHARENAKREGVADRVRFEVADTGCVQSPGNFDLAVIIEAVHDVSRPVEFLAGARRLLAPGGSLIVADERVADAFTAPGDFLERFFYAASVLVCLPSGMSEQPSAATGAVLRKSTIAEYAREAGFSRFVVLPLEHPSMNFYRLTP